MDSSSYNEHTFTAIHSSSSAMSLIKGWISGSTAIFYIGGNDASDVLGFASQPHKTGIVYSFQAAESIVTPQTTSVIDPFTTGSGYSGVFVENSSGFNTAQPSLAFSSPSLSVSATTVPSAS